MRMEKQRATMLFGASVALGSAFAGVAASLAWKATEAECVVGRIVSPGVAWKATLGHARTLDTYHLYQCTTHPQRPAPDPRFPPQRTIHARSRK